MLATPAPVQVCDPVGSSELKHRRFRIGRCVGHGERVGSGISPSVADMVMTLTPDCSGMLLRSHVTDVPVHPVQVASPDPPRSFAHVTLVTPTASVAVPLMFMLLLEVE